MSNDYKNKKFQELLDRLQQESWQLELIISGFAIFGLFTALPRIELSLHIAKNDNQIYTFIIGVVALVACYILIFNLLIHVILRGLWIGALGLRYVSGDIDFEELNYQNKFTNYLKSKIVSFDRYVGRLENYCSVLFAISFLLIFYVISITIIIVLFILIANYIISNDSLAETPRTIVGATLITIVSIGSLFVFLDFITQGYLKKKKWLSKIYFPFYWLFSFLTLSFLYRPLVYNFLDNKFTKRISLFLVPAYLIIIIFNSIKHQNSNYIDNKKSTSYVYLDKKEYDDLLIEENDFISNASIQSKVITGSYIKLFKVFNKNVEERIYDFNPSLKPEDDKRGFRTGLKFSNSNKNTSSRKRDSLARKYIETFNYIYEIHIDSTTYKSDFMISTNIKNQTGFETYLSTRKLTDGRHMLTLKRKYIKKKDTIVVNNALIPFWYYKK